MSTKSMAKNTDEVNLDFFKTYRLEHGGAVRMYDVAQWICDNQLLPDPTMAPVRLHTRRLKLAARKKRIRDLNGRKVRQVVAVKVKKMTAGGQKVFDVVWDILHEMSENHFLSHFEQRDNIITQQRLAATRDLLSCLDFNPNVSEQRGQVKFAFILEESREMVEELIDESEVSPTAVPPSPENREGTDPHPLTTQKPH